MDLKARMKELEEELEAERSIRAKGKQALRSGLSLVQQQNKLLKEQLEKTKQRLQEAKASSCSQSQIEGWKKESRQHDRELFKLKTGHEEHLEELEALRMEKKTFQEEIAVLKDKLSDVNESVCELHKVLKKLEKEKEKLQTSLGKSDAALEQVIENLQSEAEKVNLLIKEKKELQGQAKDLENQLEQERERSRKSNKKSLDKMEQMKSFLEELLMSNDMELLEFTISKLEGLKTKQQLMNQQILSLLEEEKRDLSCFKTLFQSQMEGTKVLRSSQSLMQLENEVLKEQLEEEDSKLVLRRLIFKLNHVAMQLRGKHEADDIQHADEPDKTMKSHQRALESKRASPDLKLNCQAGGLRSKGEHREQERHCALLVNEGEETHSSIESTERSGKTLKAELLEATSRCHDVSIQVKELDWEQKQHADAAKILHKNEQRWNELLFQSKEDHKNQQRMHELVERLKNKMKAYKRRAEEAEEQASVNLAKYRNTTHELDDAKEWVDIAKWALSNISINN